MTRSVQQMQGRDSVDIRAVEIETKSRDTDFDQLDDDDGLYDAEPLGISDSIARYTETITHLPGRLLSPSRLFRRNTTQHPGEDDESNSDATAADPFVDSRVSLFTWHVLGWRERISQWVEYSVTATADMAEWMFGYAFYLATRVFTPWRWFRRKANEPRSTKSSNVPLTWHFLGSCERVSHWIGSGATSTADTAEWLFGYAVHLTFRVLTPWRWFRRNATDRKNSPTTLSWRIHTWREFGALGTAYIVTTIADTSEWIAEMTIHRSLVVCRYCLQLPSKVYTAVGRHFRSKRRH